MGGNLEKKIQFGFKLHIKILIKMHISTLCKITLKKWLPFGMGWDSGTSELGPLNKWNPVFGMFCTNCLVRASSNWSLHTGLIPRAWHIKSIGSWDILSKWSIWLSEDSIRTVRQPRLAPSISSRRAAKLHTEKQQSRKIRNILSYSHDILAFNVFQNLWFYNKKTMSDTRFELVRPKPLALETNPLNHSGNRTCF